GQLIDALGVSIYVLLASWFVLVVLLFLRQIWWMWALRLLGWLLLVPCAAVLADWLGPTVCGGPLTGSGGTLGAWLAHWLAEQMPPLPRGVLLAISIVLGLLLAVDQLVFGAARAVGRLKRAAVRWLRRSLAWLVAWLPTRTA